VTRPPTRSTTMGSRCDPTRFARLPSGATLWDSPGTCFSDPETPRRSRRAVSTPPIDVTPSRPQLTSRAECLPQPSRVRQGRSATTPLLDATIVGHQNRPETSPRWVFAQMPEEYVRDSDGVELSPESEGVHRPSSLPAERRRPPAHPYSQRQGKVAGTNRHEWCDVNQ